MIGALGRRREAKGEKILGHSSLEEDLNEFSVVQGKENKQIAHSLTKIHHFFGISKSLAT